MPDETLHGLDKAQKAVAANASPRYREIDLLERYADGTQYEGRPNWWTAVDVPLAEREPCVVYPVAGIAIASFVDLVLGEHRFPELDVEGVASENLRRLRKSSRFASTMREGLASGLSARSACIIAGKRNDRSFLDTVPAKWSVPTFSGDGCTIESLEIRYPYITEERDARGRWCAKAKIFRRVIDDTKDTTFLPVDARISDTREPEWTIDKARTFAHDLGYCPVVWWACMRGASIEGRYDGHALHEKVLDEITALDLSLSQRQRAAFMAGDPQWTETGVTPGYNPAPGRHMIVPASPGTTTVTDPKGNKITSSYVSTSGGSARKKGPGIFWQYEDPQSKVELHQLAAGALDAIDKNSHDLRMKICDALAYVPLDPQSLPRLILSGKAIEALKERQLARCDYLRDDVADGLIIPALALLCRIEGLADKVDDEHVTIDWPPYYTPNAEDRAKELGAEVQATTTASAYIKNPAYDRIAKKRIARLVLDGQSDEDLEAIDDAIDAQPVEQPTQPTAQQPPNGLPPGVVPSQSSTPQTLPSPSPAGGAKVSNGGTPNGNAAPEKATPSRAAVPNIPKAAAAAKPDEKPSPSDTTNEPPAATKGTSSVKQAPAAIHQRAASAAGVADTVYALLTEDYPKDTIDWVRAAHWEGPLMVSLDQLDFQNRDQWNATDEQAKVDEFVEKISNGEMKPIVLVNEPNDNKLRIIDGHHRALAYEKLNQPAMAYVAHVGTVGGPWDAMHSSQKSVNKPDANPPPKE